MKNLLLILFLFISVCSFGQTGETKPSGTKPLQTPNNATFSFLQLDTTLYISMGAYGVMKIVGAKKLRYQLDSLAIENDTEPYKIEIASDGVTTYTIPFRIRGKSQVWYNGSLIRPELWTGSGTTSLTVSIDTRVRDFMIIKK